MWIERQSKVRKRMEVFLLEHPLKQNIIIRSTEIYERLISEGVEVGEGDMAFIFKDLKDRRFIEGPGNNSNGEEMRKHGDFTITKILRYP